MQCRVRFNDIVQVRLFGLGTCCGSERRTNGHKRKVMELKLARRSSDTFDRLQNKQKKALKYVTSAA